ncbi:hypothetical protein GTQ43_35835 [Nostoc sp. KVJ3]|nr:hypothetical protein [Nostoc sp. KVJ3]
MSDTLRRNPHEEETAHAPLGGASPQSVQGVSENEEDSPTANDCTSLALVDDAQNNPALLLAENHDCGDEPKDCHEGTCSTASVAQNEFRLNSAIANQTQGQVEQSNPASLMAENSVSGVGVKAVYEGESSVALVLNPEKWSHEAILARANVRPARMQKLKVAANSGQNPGFDFLQECWNDDPALGIVIKKLLAKFPHWGIVCADGVLVKCSE